MPRESEILRNTKNEAGKHGTEEPASVGEVVVPQINDNVSGDVRQDERGGHVHADRLEYDDKQRYEGPIGARTHGETRPPPLNGDQEYQPGPDHGRKVELNLRPRQDEPAEALQDLRYCQPEHYRQQDRKIVKGRFQALRKVCVSPKATPRCARPLAAPRVATNEPIHLVNSAPESRPPI